MVDEKVCVEQQGTVEEIAGHKVFVRIRQISACGDCHARSLCSMTEMEDKLIEADDNSLNLHQGDRVNVTMTRSMGNRAVLLGYMIPFLLLITLLLVLSAAHLKEGIIGLAAVAILLAYYTILHLFRDRLKKSFTFTLSKTD